MNAVGMLVLVTVLTAPRFIGALELDPSAVLRRPWTALTYMFVHGGLLHLGLTSLALFVFGPPVERRLGGRRFIAYYLYCGAGAALFAAGLSGVLDVPPFVGASGAVFGVLFAFAACWPDAEVSAVPVPFPLTAKTIFLIAIAVDAVAALLVGTVAAQTGVAHLVHVGGAAAGYLFFRLASFSRRRPAPQPTAIVRRPVVTPMRVEEPVSELRPAPAPSVEHHAPDTSDDEIDRVLDKISQFGIDSLTNQERKFLSDISKRKRGENS
jgi:membrane associated rhomboid family serine protease